MKLIDGYNLLHQGTLALSAIESNGMRIDVKYLDSTIKKVSHEIKELETEIKEHKVFRLWKRTFRDRTKLGSRSQLSTILFDKLGIDSGGVTESGRKKADEEVLSQIDNPFVKKYLKIEKLKKTLSTSLMGIKREVTSDGFLHPSYHLNTARSFRGSSSDPNGQNFPKRVEEVARMVRTAFIPRGNNRILLGKDFKAAEVCVAACYNKDPTLVKYIVEKGDMHRDVAKDLFKVENVTSDMRFVAKNTFTFAEFYGDYFVHIAPKLWKAIQEYKFPKPFQRYEDFEKHVEKVEKDFWLQKFPVYTQWKNDWWEKYLKRGWFRMKTGFICSGVMERNQVINYPVQGSSFHCLLWVLIRLQKWLEKNKLKSVIIGQIHDSILLDVPLNEFDKVDQKIDDLVMRQLPNVWDWIIVPLSVESEVYEQNWFEKRN
jgi:DNA polymerase I